VTDCEYYAVPHGAVGSATVETGEPVRSPEGPQTLAGDTWDAGTGSLFVGGGREIRRHRMPRQYVWVTVLALALVSAGIAVTLLWGSGGDADPTGPGAAGTATGGASASASMSAAASASPSTSANVLVVATAPPLAAAFDPISIEAEAGMPRVKLRAASEVSLDGGSGGRGVQFGGSGQATIEFRQLAIPEAGIYRVTVFYTSRDDFVGVMRGSGDPVDVLYSPAPSCCATLTVNVRLGLGGSLHLELAGGDGPRPIVDRILIDLG
jgi:hypothetical protein